MTELETKLIDLIELEQTERETERKELHTALKVLQMRIESLESSQQKIIELLKENSEDESIEEMLKELLTEFSRSLNSSLTESLTQSAKLFQTSLQKALEG